MKSATALLLVMALAATPLAAQDSDLDPDPRAVAIGELMARYEELGLFSGAVLAAEGGEIVYEGAVGSANRELGVPNTADTRFRIASLTKPFTRTLVLQMVEEGALGLNDTLAEVLPGYDGEGASEITIDHLFSHTSGLVGENYVRDLDDIERHHWTKQELLEHIAGYDLVSRPGERYRYSNFGYFLLAAVMEEVSGRTYEELLQERICKPAGMTRTCADVTTEVIDGRAAGYHFYEETGIVNAPMIEMSFVYGYGHLLSTVRDLFLFDRALRSCQLLSLEHTERLLAANAERDPLGTGGQEVDVLRFGGSINGFLASAHSYTQDDRYVAVLLNVKDSRGGTLPSSFDVGRNVAAILYGLEYFLPK